MNDGERISHRTKHEMHDCVVPGCGQRADEAFIVNEVRRLAGRAWKPGDFIDLCAPHSVDVRRAEYGPVAEWLRPM